MRLRQMVTGFFGVGAFVGALSIASCQGSEAVITLFYLENRTGAAVQVRVLADGQELFVRRVGTESQVSAVAVPPGGQYPAVEMKISMKTQVRKLEVQEQLFLRQQKVFDISGYGKAGAGFRIVITRDGILLARDYYPIR